MQSVITAKECSNMVDQLMNSEIGQRITNELQSSYQPNSDGDYPEVYWDEMNELHIEALKCFIEHLSDSHKPFHDQLS